MLVGQPNAEELARDIVKRGLNVRQVEELARKDGRAQAREVKGSDARGKDADTMALERRVSDALGLNVTRRPQGQGRRAAHRVRRPRAAGGCAAEAGAGWVIIDWHYFPQ